MLRGIQNASKNWLGRSVLIVIVALIAFSFAIWGIGDMFRGFGQSTVATVGGAEIRIETFRQLYQDRLQQLSRSIGRPILPDQARALGIDRQLLAQLIAETVIDERARKFGLSLEDAEIARRITEDENFRSITGQFDRMRFDQALRNLGYTEARFMAEQRRDLIRHQLIGTVGAETPAPRTAVDALNRFQNEQRTIEYVVLGRAQAGDVPDPTPEVLSRYFEERKALFRAPEYRKLTLVVLTPESFADAIEVAESEIKRFYEDRKARYETPERRHVQQIVFPNLEEARAGADKIAKGTDFAALAAERELKEADIDLGTVAKSAIVDRAVADAAFALKLGEVSAPVEGRFGIALVRVLKIEPPQTRSLDDVATEIRREIATGRSRNEILDVQEKVEDERLGGLTLPDAARKIGLKPITIEAVDRSGRGPDGKPVAGLPQGIDVLGPAFISDLGGHHEALRIPGGGYVWYDVDDIQPSRERSLDEVKEQVLTRWRDDEIASRLKAKAEAMVDQIKAGRTLAEVAASEGLKPEWRPGIKRGSPPAGIPERAIAGIFQTPKDAASSVDGATPTERLVFRVTEITVPPFDPQSTAAKQIDEALRRGIAGDIVTQYVSRLQNEIGVHINQSVLSQVAGGTAN